MIKLAQQATHWLNPPQQSAQLSEDNIRITAGPKTDWFIDPAGKVLATNAPVLLFRPPDNDFLFSARVSVDFADTYDAGVLFLYSDKNCWGKLCFEYSPQKEAMVVSVVTRDVSDDCNSLVIEGNSICLRASRQGNIFIFHYSLDGKYWHFVRYFSLGEANGLQIGLSAQSPTGQGCRATFSEISYRSAQLTDMRNGE